MDFDGDIDISKDDQLELRGMPDVVGSVEDSRSSVDEYCSDLDDCTDDLDGKEEVDDNDGVCVIAIDENNVGSSNIVAVAVIECKTFAVDTTLDINICQHTIRVQ